MRTNARKSYQCSYCGLILNEKEIFIVHRFHGLPVKKCSKCGHGVHGVTTTSQSSVDDAVDLDSLDAMLQQNYMDFGESGGATATDDPGNVIFPEEGVQVSSLEGVTEIQL